MVLELRGIAKHFGAIQALQAVDLRLARGEVLGLMGDNGAGKSTLVKIIAGSFAPSAGEMRIDGEPVAFARPLEAREAGVEIVHQDLALCDNLTASLNAQPTFKRAALELGIALVQKGEYGDAIELLERARESEELEAREQQTLAPQAAHSAASRGRLRPEREDDVRPAFQRDRDRIIHCKAFRRLKHKTQVFFAPTGDHYRTRLTHTLEVSQIARTIAKVLRLQEELTEAIALGHDLGHTPFGHAGERVLSSLVPGGFNHYEQSLRIVDVLENDRQGLNLTWEVRDGIARHSKGKSGLPVGLPPEHRASTIDGQVARVADIIAYVNHDFDDAVRAGLLRQDQLPERVGRSLGYTSSERIGCMVSDVVHQTLDGGLSEIRMSDRVLEATLELRRFLFESVYENEVATAEFSKAEGILGGLWQKVRQRPAGYLDPRTIELEGLDIAAQDFVAGMTDRFAVSLYEQLFIPKPWVEIGS